MTAALLKTKAEQALIENFRAAEPDLPGSGWVQELRRHAIRRFDALGLPHRRIEEWKYTDLRERMRQVPWPAPSSGGDDISRAEVDQALAGLAAIDAYRMVFVDGRFLAGASTSKEQLPSSIEVLRLRDILGKGPAWLQSKFTAARLGTPDAVSALNLAFMADGMVLKVKAGAVFDRPILIAHIRSARGSGAVTTRHVVSVEAAARVTLIDAHVTLGSAPISGPGNYATDLDIADGADVQHIKVMVGGTDDVHVSGWRVRIGEAAVYRGFQLTAGAPFVRNEIVAGFTGANAKFDLSGVFLGRGRDHIDTTLTLEHSTPGCESRELFKGVLDGRARGVFQGKIVVRPVAQKTDGKQMAQALMLSADAEFDSKPELEIYADDVVCGHGSTVAQLDPEMLFYLRSRGIPEADARSMLIESFMAEPFEKLESEPVREALRGLALAWLGQSPTLADSDPAAASASTAREHGTP